MATVPPSKAADSGDLRLAGNAFDVTHSGSGDRRSADIQARERIQRDHERSEEAHWQVAEAAAEEVASEPDHQSVTHEPQWEDEGGALGGKPLRRDRDSSNGSGPGVTTRQTTRKRAQ